MSDDQMLREHRQTFNGFVRGSTISSVVIVITLVLMALFLL